MFDLSAKGRYKAQPFQIDVEVPDQGMLSIPDSAGYIRAPPLNNFTVCQVFHPELFNILLSVLAPKDRKELSCIPDQDHFGPSVEGRGEATSGSPLKLQVEVTEYHPPPTP
ncbi:hypothetical protein JRQ81_014509 [Phrynocephalus forsythii]|uniref:Uncharacterized protein n=1 Tax=Phrynocephalus forsythii TaxID=171643 RepID=A0A9Q0XWV3_9SAUR|nr:hypothetical protein JRQ81_014509 [Phrynocephalus forsythii]